MTVENLGIPEENLMTIDDLNQRFGLPDELVFTCNETGMTLLSVENANAKACFTLQGAHLLRWKPANTTEEVIWLSEQAVFSEGKSIRGGIPLCWPWFGAHPQQGANWPAHGFARTSLWGIVATQSLDEGATRIQFALLPNAQTEAMWPSGARVFYNVTIGRRLELELITQNKGDQPVHISQALHSYFQVGDVQQVKLHGLSNTEYLDKLAGFERKRQQGVVTINQEVDRIYLDTANDCVIEDERWQRNIVIIKCGSHSTVVWNPWREIAEKMADMGQHGYQSMLCVESANAADDAVVVAPGKAHHLWVQYEVTETVY